MGAGVRGKSCSTVCFVSAPLARESILQLARRHARVDVLVTVKASPQPSSSYGDTVCVAGILMEDQPRWIRLYPVPFRYLDGPQQFDKYAPISVELHEATQDRRPESAKINVASIRVGEVIPPWQGRAPWVEPLVTGTMCELLAGTRANLNAASIGAIRPADVDSDLTFKVHPPWSAAQAASLLAAESQGELFGQRGPALKPPRLKAILHYRCEAAGCNGHDQHIIDWELTALQRRGDRLSDDDLKKSITRRFMHQMFLADTDPVIFVGNQADVRRRASFTVLGVYYPKRQPPPEFALF